MAFCTQCGATLFGAFCSKCGKRRAESTESAPAAASAAPSAVTPAAAPAVPAAEGPARRKTSPLVWVLVVILCLCGVGVIGVVGLGAFVFHKAKQAGIDSELWRTNPGAAVGRMMAAVNPNLEVVRTNDADRTVILRDRHTGKQFRIAIDSARNGSLSLQADDEGKSARLDIGGDAKVPNWVPKYPGSRIQPGFSASGESHEGSGEAGTFVFKTGDRGSRVLEFYEQKAREMGLELHTLATDGQGVVAAGDAERDRYLKVVIIGGSDETTVNVTYARKR